jgi:hypothetical protein
MSGVNLYTEVEAKRWITEYERNEEEKFAHAARCREGHKPYVERRKSIVDRAVDAGMEREAFLNVLKIRKAERGVEALKQSESEGVRESRIELLEKLGGLANLPLGEAALAANQAKPSKGSPDFSDMTLDEARAILAEPKGKGRPSAAAVARRKAAEGLVGDADKQVAVEAGLSGASSDQAAAMADAMDAAMGPNEVENNVRDFRPRFAQRDATPPEAA